MIFFGCVIFLIDYLSKLWANFEVSKRTIKILPCLDFVYVQNKGVSFGILFGVLPPWLLGLLSGFLCFFLIKTLWPKSNPKERYGYVAIIAGAIGNIVDRFIEGAVVDFIYFHIGEYGFPAFNIADSAICLGVAWIMILQYQRKKILTTQKV
jgi:signal peptidase II